MENSTHLNVVQEIITYIEHSKKSSSGCDLDFVLLRLKGIPGVDSFSDDLQRAVRTYLLAEKNKMENLNSLDKEINSSDGVVKASLHAEKYELVFNLLKYLSTTGKMSTSDIALLGRQESDVLHKVVELHKHANEIVVASKDNVSIKKFYADPNNEDTKEIMDEYTYLRMRMLDLTEIVPSGPLPEHSVEHTTEEAL